MNVNDISDTGNIKDKLSFIFERQRELMVKYDKIEVKNEIGYYLTLYIPFDINNKKWQYLLKDFAWRITEELAECMAIDLDIFQPFSPEEKKKSEEKLIHAQEEASDALHFLVELLINVGIGPPSFILKTGDADPWEYYFKNNIVSQSIGIGAKAFRNAAMVKLLVNLGLAMNCLKQKPWKQTHFETDLILFQKYLIKAFEGWVKFATELGMDSEKAFQMYFKKSEVNKFRQRSNY